MSTPPIAHAVKVARSLALTGTFLLPACGASPEPRQADDGPGAPEAQATDAPPARNAAEERGRSAGAAAIARAAAPTEADAGPDADVEAGPRISGPLPPPELPARLV